MAITAQERAQRELEKATAQVEKCRDKLTKATDKANTAEAARLSAERDLTAAMAVSDYVSQHPALTQGEAPVFADDPAA